MNSLSTGGMFIMMIPKLNPVTSAKTISIFITRSLPSFDPCFSVRSPLSGGLRVGEGRPRVKEILINDSL